MPDWQQWLTQNAPWLNSLYSVLGIVGMLLAVLAFLFRQVLKRLFLKILSSWSHHPKKAAKQLPNLTLSFVPMEDPFNQWQVASDGKKSILFISTLWHVTNVPGSGLPVRLLKAHLLKPFAKDLMYTTIIPIASSRDETIPEGETVDIRIHCHIARVPKSQTPFEVHLAIEDQFAEKHPLPPVEVFSPPG